MSYIQASTSWLPRSLIRKGQVISLSKRFTPLCFLDFFFAGQEFIRKTVPYFFGLEDDQAETSMSHDEMAHLSVVFAGFTRTTALLRCQS